MTCFHPDPYERIPILLPLWRRLERLPKTVEQLNAQTDQNFILVATLNGSTPERMKQVSEAMWALNGPYMILDRPDNAGGWARFWGFTQVDWAHLHGSESRLPRFAITLDDDVDMRRGFIKWCRDHADAKAICGRHGFRFNKPDGSYWDRRGAGDDIGSPDAHMVSTQASVLDAEVLYGKELYDIQPAKVMGMEDLWLCFVATVHHNYRIRASSPPVQMSEDGRDIWPTLRQKKNELLQHLRARGWKV